MIRNDGSTECPGGDPRTRVYGPEIAGGNDSAPPRATPDQHAPAATPKPTPEQGYGPVTMSEPRPLPEPHEIVSGTADYIARNPMPPPWTPPRVTAGMVPDVALYAPEAKLRKAKQKAKPRKAPAAVMPVPVPAPAPPAVMPMAPAVVTPVPAAVTPVPPVVTPAPAPVAPAPAAPAPVPPAPAAPAPPYSAYGQLWEGSARITNPEASLLLRRAGLYDRRAEVRSLTQVIAGDDVRAYLAAQGIAETVVPPLLPALTEAEAATIVDALLGHGLHLLRLQPEGKAPVESGWTTAETLTRDEAIEWLTGGGNLGWNVGRSNRIVVDCEDAAAVAAMVAAGFRVDVVTANSLDPTSGKFGGGHVVFDLPDDVDTDTLRSVLQVPLGGGTVDILAGARYAVAPGSQLWEARSGRYAAVGPFAEGTTNGAAPGWLWGHGEAPPAVAELAGVLAPRAARPRVASPGGDALTDQVDAISWDEWLDRYDVDRRISVIGVDGGCGCEVCHYEGAATDRSGILHDGCEYGFGAHFFSGTVQAGLGAEHASRLQLAAWLAGRTVGDIMREMGLGGPAFGNDDDAAADPDGLPEVDPELATYQARAAHERAASTSFPHDFTVDPRTLLPRDRRGLHAAVFGPRASAVPVSVRCNQAEAAEAIAHALQGRVLRDAERSSKERDVLYGWDGEHFREDKDAAETAVKGLMHARNFAADPAEAQTKVQVVSFRKPTPDEKEEQLKAMREKFASMGVALDETKFRAQPVPFVDPSWAATDQATKSIARMVVREPSCRVARTSEFDADRRVVGAPGGYILLGETTFKVVAPDPRYRVTKMLGAHYDPDWDREPWENFMATFLRDPAVRSYVQELAGSSLEGGQDNHAVPLLSGAGGNGKGVFLEGLKFIMGDYYAAMEGRTLTKEGRRGHSVDYMPLRGARVAVWEELPGTQVDVDLLKQLSGGGDFTCRGIGESPITFPLTHQPWLTSNNNLELPPGQRRALRRRIRKIVCGADYSGEQGSEGKPIVGLGAQLCRQAGPGMVAWALEGWQRWAERGRTFDEPAAVTAATNEAMAQLSTWSAFCSEVFDVTGDAGDLIYIAPIFELWKYYRGENSDQTHSRPGGTRAVPAALQQELPPRMVKVVQSYGKYKAHATGVRWSQAGMELLQEMQKRGAFLMN